MLPTLLHSALGLYRSDNFSFHVLEVFSSLLGPGTHETISPAISLWFVGGGGTQGNIAVASNRG